VFTGRLYGVTATSPGNAWAVGLHPDSSLIIHWDGGTWTQQLASAVITAARSTSPQERPDGLCQFVRVVVVGGVRAGRARDLDTQAAGQSAGGLGVDGVALVAHKHHDGA